MEHLDKDLKGADLLNLVVDIEAVVGGHAAGMTPLGLAIVALCESAIKLDRAKLETVK